MSTPLACQAGAINSLEAIDAERTALSAQRETVAAATEHRLAVTALYKSLGGGWEDVSTFLATTSGYSARR